MRRVLCGQGGLPDHRSAVKIRQGSVEWSASFAGLVCYLGESGFVSGGEKVIPGWNVTGKPGLECPCWCWRSSQQVEALLCFLVVPSPQTCSTSFPWMLSGWKRDGVVSALFLPPQHRSLVFVMFSSSEFSLNVLTMLLTACWYWERASVSVMRATGAMSSAYLKVSFLHCCRRCCRWMEVTNCSPIVRAWWGELGVGQV